MRGCCPRSTWPRRAVLTHDGEALIELGNVARCKGLYIDGAVGDEGESCSLDFLPMQLGERLVRLSQGEQVIEGSGGLSRESIACSCMKGMDGSSRGFEARFLDGLE